MKKSGNLVVALLAIIVVVVGVYFIFHKSKTTTNNTKTSPPKSSVAAVNNAVVLTKTNSKVGQYLTDQNGNTLYTYAADTTNTSRCVSTCLSVWPAYQDKGPTTGLPSSISVFERPDNNEVQYAYNGKPLYYFSEDKKGQINGNNVDDFHVAVPAATSTTTLAPAAPYGN